MRPDKRGQAFIVCPVMRPQYNDGHKTYYPSRLTMFDSSS